MAPFNASLDVQSSLANVVIQLKEYTFEFKPLFDGGVILSIFGAYLVFTLWKIPRLVCRSPSSDSYTQVIRSASPNATAQKKRRSEPLTMKKAIIDIIPGEEDQEYILANAVCLEDLSLRDKNTSPVDNSCVFTSPLANLNPSSFTTLTRLFYRIELHITSSGNGPTKIVDPYHGLFRDRLVSRFTKLQKLEVAIWINGASVAALSQTTFGEEWGAFAKAIVSTNGNDAASRFPLPKSIRFLVGMRGGFTPGEGKQLQALMNRNLVGRHFGALLTQGWKGRITPSLSGEVGSTFTTLELKRR
ncbi:hypothetical protein NMY22_g8462 [Coprinellus aureogranulatus]|nr:hypothetical protein NMY22_g8462 [Coprinellus aureogranulatus]